MEIKRLWLFERASVLLKTRLFLKARPQMKHSPATQCEVVPKRTEY
jgi:hypothetical protein